MPLNSEQPVTFGTLAGETITLAANTTYFVYAIAVDGEVLLRHTQDKGEDPDSNEGWSIADKCIMYTTAGEKANCDWHAETKVYYSLMMVLNSPLEAVVIIFPPPPPTSSTTTAAASSCGEQFPDGGCRPGPDRRVGRRAGDPGRQRQQRSGRRSAAISLESTQWPERGAVVPERGQSHLHSPAGTDGR